MRAAIEYLARLRDQSRKAAEAFDEDFRIGAQKSVYWRDFYAYDKAIDALMDAPQEPETSRINFERFRAALEKEGFTPEQSMRINGALVGAMLGRAVNADASEPVQRDRRT